MDNSVEKQAKSTNINGSDGSMDKKATDRKNGSESNMSIDGKAVLDSGSKPVDNPYIVTLMDPESPISEEYRNLS